MFSQSFQAALLTWPLEQHMGHDCNLVACFAADSCLVLCALPCACDVLSYQTGGKHSPSCSWACFCLTDAINAPWSCVLELRWATQYAAHSTPIDPWALQAQGRQQQGSHTQICTMESTLCSTAGCQPGQQGSRPGCGAAQDDPVPINTSLMVQTYRPAHKLACP